MASSRNTKGKTKNNVVTKQGLHSQAGSGEGIITSRRYAEKNQAQVPDMSSTTIQVQNPKRVYNLFSQEFSGLTGDQIHFYFEAARRGVNFFKSLLFQEIRRRDLNIGGVCQTRKLAVAKEEWNIEFAPDSKIGEAQQAELKKELETIFAKIKLTNLMTDIIEAQLEGVKIFELNWMPSDNKITLDSINTIPNHVLCYDDLNNEYKFLNMSITDLQEIRQRSYQIMNDRIDLTGLTIEDIHPMKILQVFSLDGNDMNGFLNGVVDSITWGFVFKNFGVKDWAMWLERFAIPGIIAKRPALMNTRDRQALETAINDWGHVAKMVVPEGVSVDTLGDKEKTSSTDAFAKFKQEWDRDIAIRIIGNELTSRAGDKGSRALGQVHNEVREDLKVADMLLVKDAINEIIKRYCDLNYPGLSDRPQFVFKQEKDVEYKLKRSEIMSNITQMGYRVKPENIEAEFGVSVEFIGPPAPPAQNHIDNVLKEIFGEILNK